MKKGFLFGILLLFMVQGILAACEEGQIDINTASLEELQQIKGIGPVKAQNITDARPFESIDDLIRVKGIGVITLNNIKEEGLACVSGEVQDDDAEEDEKEGEIIERENLSNKKKASKEIKELSAKAPPETPEVIKLGTQNLKGESDSEEAGASYATYGLAGFMILLGLLFLLNKRKNKNEFE